MSDKDKLPAGTEEEFKSLILGIADTKLLLGYHFGEWTFRTPTLESGIATCNFSQDELGHVRLFHGLLKNYSNETDLSLLHDRESEDYKCVRSLNSIITNWLELVSLSVIIDSGLTVLLKSMRESSFRPLRERVEKILQEEKFHTDYNKAWVRSLAETKGNHPQGIIDSFSKTVPDYEEWLQGFSDISLVSEGIINLSIEEIIVETFVEFDSIFSDAKLDLHNAKEIERKNNDSVSEFPSEEILYSLRGEKNETFRV